MTGIRAITYLEDIFNIDDIIPMFSNGQWPVSDYAIEPLFKLADKLDKQNDPNEIIVTLNMIMDVSSSKKRFSRNIH